MTSQWIFGYGSLIFRPGFEYLQREVATLSGYKRRFWQGSHDHRGVPDAPGRVVTLIADEAWECRGVAYLIEAQVAAETFDVLDYREKNGYSRIEAPLKLANGSEVPGIVYVATPDNVAFLGETTLNDMAKQIATSEGPSGHNRDYLFDLASALRTIEADDAHVFELEQQVRRLVHNQVNTNPIT